MIEVVYNKEEESQEKTEILLPKNIRQVGNVEGFRKICIEDYAYNFIEEYPDEGKTCVGILLGESKKQKKEQILFIHGSMSVENVEVSGDEIHFTEDTWNAVYEGMKKYFPESSIVGWYVISSTESKDRLAKLKKVHTDNFAGNEKVLLLVDRLEGSKSFCVYENNRLEKLSGYIIYYEKNENMQNYLIEKRQGTKVEEEQKERVKGNFRNLLKEAAKEEKPSKSVFVSYAANAVLVVMILFVGMYMVSSHERINQLDTSMTEMSKEISDKKVEKGTMPAVPIMEISGNVYPLPEETGEISVETGEALPLEEVTTQEETESVTEAPQEEVTVSNPVSVTAKTYETYEVKKGETLITISKKFYGNTAMIDSIMALNDIENRDCIYEGQIIKLP